jgi:glycine/D-amino acid oxidase-like deaminating enzyme
MVQHTRVVIIGGGAVGVSSLYHLAKTGWTDCVLLEQNELTSGSTWHAAGNCPTFSTSWGLLKLQKYSAELYRRLGDEVGYPINYHIVGAIRLAHTRERMDEFKHVRSMARANGMEYEMIAPELWASSPCRPPTVLFLPLIFHCAFVTPTMADVSFVSNMANGDLVHSPPIPA